MIDRLGQQLGNYRLTRRLGQGGFAEVYLGEHVVLGTMVAIKVLYTRIGEGDRAQFEKEARLLASLKHPHIIRMLDFGLDGQTPYLVMDYAANGALRALYAKGTQLPLSIVVSYVKQIALALQYAHDRKIVHRDIKPENILVGEQGEILLSDFGIALIVQSSRYQSTKDMVGTIAYMAPEQIEKYPRPASDQYSLAVVVYEWLCGTLPFHGLFTEIAIKHKLALPPPPREYLPTLSPYVEHVILTALAKEPDERFASVSAFAVALEQAGQDMLLTERGRLVSSSSVLYAPPSKPPAESVVSYTTPFHQSVSVSASRSEAPPGSAQTVSKSRARRVSRRAVLIGATGVVGIVAVGTGILVVTHQQILPNHVVTGSGQTATSHEPTVATQTPTVTPQNLPFTYRGHDAEVWSVAWSPDGKWIASVSSDKTAQVWNTSDGGDEFRYRNHQYSVDKVAWSPPDGKRIASGSDDRTVQVWNASDGGNVFKYQGHSDHVNAVAWSPDGKRIASGSADRTVQVWNASDGGNVFKYQGHSDMLWEVAWSPDGKRIASASTDTTVQVWNASDGGNPFTYDMHFGWVFTAAWSPDGKRIASGSSDATVQVWNSNDGGNVLTYAGHSDTVRSVAWSPDGKQVASGSEDGTVQVWNASDGSHVFTYAGHQSWVYSVMWSPDGKRIASGSGDRTVQVWNVK